MKNAILWVWMVGLVSVSAFADSNCTYMPQGIAGRGRYLHLSKTLGIVTRKLEKRGFTQVYESSKAKYTLEFFTDYSYGAWNGLEHKTFGDGKAYVKLIRNSDNKVLYDEHTHGVSGVLGPIGRNLKSRILLKSALADLPECSLL